MMEVKIDMVQEEFAILWSFRCGCEWGKYMKKLEKATVVVAFIVSCKVVHGGS